MDRTWELRPDETPTALLAGTLTGAGLTALPFIVTGPAILLAFVVALIPWGLAVFVLGPPAWWVVHRYTNRDPGWFLFAGFGVTFAGTLALAVATGGPGSNNLAIGVTFAFILAVVGALVGLAIWKVGYREAEAANPATAEVFQ